MRPLIVGNWKMNGRMRQLGEIEALTAFVASARPHVDILICTSATLITRAAQIAAGRMTIGGQNCHAASAGAFTGEISAEMLKDAGASAVLVGHSERREHHGETDAMVSARRTPHGARDFRSSSVSVRRSLSAELATGCPHVPLRSQPACPKESIRLPRR